VSHVETYTNGSLTETTKTFPASFRAGWLMKPGTWELEHAGPVVREIHSSATGTEKQAAVYRGWFGSSLNAAGTPTITPLP
jgi:hypothetical protein